MNMSRQELKRSTGKDGNSIENTREALLFFFSPDGSYLRGLLEDTISDGIESLSKGAIINLLQRILNKDQEISLPNGGKKKLGEFKTVNLSEADQKRID